MKILVFEQDNCGWCTRLHPHINKLSEEFDILLEFINITDRWELADQYQFRSTPTVVITDNGNLVLRKFSIEAGKGIPQLISSIKDFIKQ